MQAQVEAMLRAHDAVVRGGDQSRMATHPALTAGTQLGAYEVLAELGAGGMGEVCRARDAPLGVAPLVNSPSIERNGIVSSDGRWLAYESTDSGQPEIYVRPYPNGPPLWSRSGQELFHVSETGAILGASVRAGASWAGTSPTIVVKGGYATAAPANPGRTYDISPDGQRFLVVKPECCRTYSRRSSSSCNTSTRS